MGVIFIPHCHSRGWGKAVDKSSVFCVKELGLTEFGVCLPGTYMTHSGGLDKWAALKLAG